MIAVGKRGPDLPVRFDPPDFPQPVKFSVPKEIMKESQGRHAGPGNKKDSEQPLDGIYVTDRVECHPKQQSI